VSLWFGSPVLVVITKSYKISNKEPLTSIRPLEKIFCAIVKDYFFPEIFLNKITIIFQFFE
jgi:hypothetical protein